MKQLKSTVIYYSICFAAAVPVLALAYIFLLRSVTGPNMANPSISMIITAAVFAMLGILTILKGVIPWMRMVANIWRVLSGQARLSENAGCSMRQGPLGAGKTSSAGYEIVVKAVSQWRELQKKYKLTQPFAEDWQNELTVSKNDLGRLGKKRFKWNRNSDRAVNKENLRLFLKANRAEKIRLQRKIQVVKDNLFEWRRVRDAYRFWKARPHCFPCLFSNVPITVDGFEVCVFTIDHVAQKQRLPAYSCVLVDETEWFIDQDLYKNKSVEVELIILFYRFFRQFFGNGGRWIGTQQNAGSVFNQMRNVMTSNDTMIDQRPILKPSFLLWLLDRRFNKLMKKPSLSRPQAEKFLKFEKFATGIGFRVFDYHISGGILSTDVGPTWSNKVKLVAPMRLNFTYNDNAFAQLYAVKDDKLYAETFQSRFVDPDTAVLRHDSAEYAATVAVEKKMREQRLKANTAPETPAHVSVDDVSSSPANRTPSAKKTGNTDKTSPVESAPASAPADSILSNIFPPALVEKLHGEAGKRVSSALSES